MEERRCLSRVRSLAVLALVILPLLGTASTIPAPVLGQNLTSSSYTVFKYSNVTLTSGTVTVGVFSGTTTLQVSTVTYLTTTTIHETLTLTTYIATVTGLAVPAATQTSTTVIVVPESTMTVVYLSPLVQINGTLTIPVLTQNTTRATEYLSRTMTLFVTSSLTSLTSSSGAFSQITSSTATTSEPSDSWGVLVPLLIIGIGAVVSAIVGVVIAILKRRRTLSAMVLTCPRCLSPVNPYDTFCRNCRTPLYQAHRHYPNR